MRCWTDSQRCETRQVERYRSSVPFPSRPKTRLRRRGAASLALVGAVTFVFAPMVAVGAGRATRDKAGLYLPQGRPTPAAVPFDTSSIADTTKQPRLRTLLIIGSDARPKQDFARQRGDSIHLLVWNSAANHGSLLGIPRDTMAPVPGRGRTKINSALATGGPSAMTQSVSALTGIPVSDYVVTGFEGFERMVDQLGGINVQIPRMNDRASGAQFAGGWYAANGKAALAFSRARKTIAGGDFQRSKNHGVVLLAALAKLRAETSNPAEVARWIAVFMKHGRTNLSPAEFLSMALVARQIDPDRLANIVIPSRAGMAGKASVVLLDAGAGPLLSRLRSTGWAGPLPAPSPTTSARSETSTTSTGPNTSTTSTGPSTSTTSTASTSTTSSVPSTSTTSTENATTTTVP